MLTAIVRRVGTFGMLLVASWLAPAVRAEETAGAANPADECAAFARRVFTITDLVLDHHLDPPTRQEMILEGAQAAMIAVGQPPPPELGRRLSEIRSIDELSDLLEKIWPQPSDAPDSIVEWQAAFLDGMLGPVAGHAECKSTNDARIESQIRANRYIGIGVSLAADDQGPRIQQVRPGGSAESAGLKAGDLIVQIDETPITKDTRLEDVVALIRGEEGSEFTMRVRGPDAEESRTVSLTRLPVFIKSVHGPKGADADDDTMEIDPDLPVGYLQISRISSSTVHELRTWETRLAAAGAKAVILDLRCGGEDSHLAALLADSLLTGNTIGKLHTRAGVREFNSDPDALFNDWPMAILIDEGSSGGAEWIAAALQDAQRAVIVGTPSVGSPFTISQVSLADGQEMLTLTTGRLERARGDEKGKGLPQILDVEARFLRRTPMVRAIGEAEHHPVASVVPDIIVKRPMRGGRPVRLRFTGGTMDAAQTAAAELQKKLRAAEELPE